MSNSFMEYIRLYHKNEKRQKENVYGSRFINLQNNAMIWKQCI